MYDSFTTENGHWVRLHNYHEQRIVHTVRLRPRFIYRKKGAALDFRSLSQLHRQYKLLCTSSNNIEVYEEPVTMDKDNAIKQS